MMSTCQGSPCQFELFLRSCVVGRRRAVGGCRFLADHGQPASYRSSVGLVSINAILVTDESLTRSRLWTATTSVLPVIRVDGNNSVSSATARYRETSLT